jgi:hypothetical protein
VIQTNQHVGTVIECMRDTACVAVSSIADNQLAGLELKATQRFSFVDAGRANLQIFQVAQPQTMVDARIAID